MSKPFCSDCESTSCESLEDPDNDEEIIFCCNCAGEDYDSMCSACRADHAADMADDSRKRSLEHPS